MTINTPTFIVTLLQPKLESDRRGPSSSSLSGDSRFCGEKLAAVAALVGVLFAWFWEKLDELNMLTWARDREGEGRARPGVTVSLSHNTPQNTHTQYTAQQRVPTPFCPASSSEASNPAPPPPGVACHRLHSGQCCCCCWREKSWSSDQWQTMGTLAFNWSPGHLDTAGHCWTLDTRHRTL